MLEVQKSSLDMAGASRLEQIRASMAGEQLGGAAAQPAAEQPSVPSADPAAVARLDELRAGLPKEKDSGDASAAS